MDHNKAWSQLKRFEIQYPEEKYPIGSSLCHWFSKRMRAPFQAVLQSLPTDSVYLELGSFLGAGSTLAALQARPDLRLICVDHWLITHESHMDNPPSNYHRPGSKNQPVDFLIGKGSSLEHFLNNTFDEQERIVPIKTTICGVFLHALSQRGISPAAIFIDDHHTEDAVFERLAVCRKLWPDAVLMLDDYLPCWPGVVSGVDKAVKKGVIAKEECQLKANRLMVLERNSTNAPSPAEIPAS